MKSLTILFAVVIVSCVTSNPVPEKVGVIEEGPGSLVIIKGPDGSVIRSQIALGVVLPQVPVVLVPAPTRPTEVELIEPKTETNETAGTDSSTEEVDASVEEVTNGSSEEIARVLQEEEKLKEVQQNEIQAQKAANAEALARIEAQQKSQAENQ